MRFHVISDNEDTLVGLRLAGIDGVIVHNEEEAQQEINKAMAKADENRRCSRCGESGRHVP